MLSLILLLCGCSGKEQASVPEEGRYQIWYLDHSATMLEPLSYNAVSGYPEELIPELVSQLMTVPNDADLVSAVGIKPGMKASPWKGHCSTSILTSISVN